MVVLVLLAVTAAAAVPAFLGPERRGPEREAATAVAALLMRARDASRESGAAATLVLAPGDGRYWITTRASMATGTVMLGGGLRIVAASPDRVTCRFGPGGPATPCAVTVLGARAVTVRVDEWNGEIRVDR